MSQSHSTSTSCFPLSPSRATTLQWGHGISAVESAFWNAANRVDKQRASMGPRHFSRGKKYGAEDCDVDTIRASMGPRHFSRGKVFRRRCDRARRQLASMGPRHFSRGKSDIGTAMATSAWSGASMGPRHFSRGKLIFNPTVQTAKDVWLQWGHGISAVESINRPNGHHWIQFASMGPRHFSRGKKKHHTSSNVTKLTLQWGHGISAVERSCTRSLLNLVSALQWGHGISAVESLVWPGVSKLMMLASMGPRHFSRGKIVYVWGLTMCSRRFNGATAFQPWKGR